MADETNGKADLRAPPVAVENISFRAQLVMMLRAFMASPLRNTIFWLAAGALAVIVATSLGQIILNRWNRPFYDAIERRDLDAFFHQLLVFAAIAGGPPHARRHADMAQPDDEAQAARRADA